MPVAAGERRLRTDRLPIEDSWPSDGRLLEGRARAWSDLGEFPRAIEWYERALEKSEALTKAVEQLLNLRSRCAASLRRGQTYRRPGPDVGRPSEPISAVHVFGPTSPSTPSPVGDPHPGDAW